MTTDYIEFINQVKRKTKIDLSLYKEGANEKKINLLV